MNLLAALLIGGAAIFLTGCRSATVPPSRADFLTDKGYASWMIACLDRAQAHGLKPWQASPLCERYGQPRLFRGIFVQEFEDEQFIENAKPAHQYVEPVKTAWLTIESSRDSPAARLLLSFLGRTTIWYVTFIGRKTLDCNLGHGHLGTTDDDILVINVLTAQRLQSVDGYATRDLLVRHKPSFCNRH